VTQQSVSFPSPENGNRSSLSSYLEFLKMDKVHEPSDSEDHEKCLVLIASWLMSDQYESEAIPYKPTGFLDDK
jgi:hypothetical protein